MSMNSGGPARPAPWPAPLSRFGTPKVAVEVVHNALDARLGGDFSPVLNCVDWKVDLFCEKLDVLVLIDWGSSSHLPLNC